MKERIMRMVEFHIKMDEEKKKKKGDGISIIPIHNTNSDLETIIKSAWEWHKRSPPVRNASQRDAGGKFKVQSSK